MDKNLKWHTIVLFFIVIFFGDNRWLLWLGMVFGWILYLNWDWLVSIGLGLMIILVAPCLIMCIWHLAMYTKSDD